MENNTSPIAYPCNAVYFTDNKQVAFFNIDGQEFIVSTRGSRVSWNDHSCLPNCGPVRGYIVFHTAAAKVFDIIEQLLDGKLLNGRGDEVSAVGYSGTAADLKYWRAHRFDK